MLTSMAMWIPTFLFSSVAVASPFLAERYDARPPSIRAGLIPKASIPRAVAVPSPVQPGIAWNCTQYYQAQTGDSCQTIVAKYSISALAFETWNPAVGSTCSEIMSSFYYCVAVGSTGSPTFSASTGAATTAVSNPGTKSTTEKTVSSGTCASAMPGYVDPNAGPIGDEQLVCTVTEANLDICSASKPCAGNATFYTISGGNTACGGHYSDSDQKAALSSDYVMGLLSSGTDPNPYCNVTSITVTYGTKSVPGIQVVDKCAGCKSVGHIDLTHGAYDALGASEGAGHVPITWSFD